MFPSTEFEPTGLTDVLLLPLICVALGLGLWYGGLHFENRTEKSWMKWCALIPIAIGLIVGIQLSIHVRDYVYQQRMPNQKTIYAHYLALALPLGTLAAVVSWHFYLKRSGAYEHRF